LIFILSPNTEDAQAWLDRRFIEAVSARIVTPEDSSRAHEYVPDLDLLIRLPGAPDDLFFEMIVK
jgi:hypothetical protein